MTVEGLVVMLWLDLVTRDFGSFGIRNCFVEIDHGLRFWFGPR